MATNITVPENKSRALAAILKAIGKSTTLGETGLKDGRHARRRVWLAPAAPQCLQAQYATSPYSELQIGDLVIDWASDDAYICTVDCAVATDATFTKITID